MGYGKQLQHTRTWHGFSFDWPVYTRTASSCWPHPLLAKLRAAMDGSLCHPGLQRPVKLQ